MLEHGICSSFHMYNYRLYYTKLMICNSLSSLYTCIISFPYFYIYGGLIAIRHLFVIFSRFCHGEMAKKIRHYSKNGEKIDGKMAERARMVKINGENREKKINGEWQ